MGHRAVIMTCAGALAVLILVSTPLIASAGQVQADPILKLYAERWKLKNYQAFDEGVLGEVGTAMVYVAPIKRIPDWSRLYWAMVRVLSEKYGCFMKSRVDHGLVTKFTCSDHRQIVFWRAKGSQWIRFYSRQFDYAGSEIAVRNKKIVRIH